MAQKNLPRIGALLCLGWVTFWTGTICPAAELQLPTLHTKRGDYTNVVVTRKTDADIYIQHDGGIGNVKLSDIEDDEALIALGLKTPATKPETPGFLGVATGTNGVAGGLEAANRYQELVLEKLKELQNHPPPFRIWSQVLAVVLLIYLFCCFCLKLICEKAGHPGGILVWLPFFQLIPAYRAAGMSAWWILAWFVPLLNLVVQIIWCFKITKARGKSVLVAIFLLLPLLNVFAFLYLAFSSAESAPESGLRPARASRD